MLSLEILATSLLSWANLSGSVFTSTSSQGPKTDLAEVREDMVDGWESGRAMLGRRLSLQLSEGGRR